MQKSSFTSAETDPTAKGKSTYVYRKYTLTGVRTSSPQKKKKYVPTGVLSTKDSRDSLVTGLGHLPGTFSPEGRGKET